MLINQIMCVKLIPGSESYQTDFFAHSKTLITANITKRLSKRVKTRELNSNFFQNAWCSQNVDIETWSRICFCRATKNWWYWWSSTKINPKLSNQRNLAAKKATKPDQPMQSYLPELNSVFSNNAKNIRDLTNFLPLSLVGLQQSCGLVGARRAHVRDGGRLPAVLRWPAHSNLRENRVRTGKRSLSFLFLKKS